MASSPTHPLQADPLLGAGPLGFPRLDEAGTTKRLEAKRADSAFQILAVVSATRADQRARWAHATLHRGNTAEARAAGARAAGARGRELGGERGWGGPCALESAGQDGAAAALAEAAALAANGAFFSAVSPYFLPVPPLKETKKIIIRGREGGDCWGSVGRGT